MKAIICSLILAAFAVDCYAQNLADVARQERERRKRLHSVLVVTSGVTTTTAASTSSTAATTAKPADAAKPIDKDRDEKYWRAQFQKARDAAKAADDKVQVLELKVRDLNTQLLRQSDIYNRENRLGPEIAEAQKQVDLARKEADQAKKKITDIEDDLRRSGGPPGWSR
jgi:peptidoglycan hydrolase CwlO-like protein